MIKISYFQPSTSKNRYNKKKNFAATQGNLIKLKEEGIELDNEFKRLQIVKIKLEIENLQKEAEKENF
jgi:hypothetical protein